MKTASKQYRKLEQVSLALERHGLTVTGINISIEHGDMFIQFSAEGEASVFIPRNPEIMITATGNLYNMSRSDSKTYVGVME